MRSSFTPRTGLRLARTPSHRQQVQRRRLMVACAMLALALASGLIGSLTAGRPDPAASGAQMGPFSYLESE